MVYLLKRMGKAGVVRHAALVVLSVMAGAICGHSAAVAQLPAGVGISVQAQPERATVGDPIRIDLDISLPKGYEAALPNLSGNFGEFTILEFHPSAPAPGGSGAPAGTEQHHRARIIAAVYRPGEFQFPPVQVTLRAPDGTVLSAFSRPLKIRIQSVLSDRDPQLKPLKKQAEMREAIRWTLWTVLVLLALALAAFGWWLWHRKRHQATATPGRAQVDSLAQAEADLRDLLGRGLLEQGLVKQFYVALCEIVKRVIESGYAVQTIERTTSEIMAELRNGSSPSRDLDRIETLLLNCDLVKFAKYVPSGTENEMAATGALGILDAVKKLRAEAAVERQAAVAGAQ